MYKISKSDFEKLHRDMTNEIFKQLKRFIIIVPYPEPEPEPEKTENKKRGRPKKSI